MKGSQGSDFYMPLFMHWEQVRTVQHSVEEAKVFWFFFLKKNFFLLFELVLGRLGCSAVHLLA
jgi:hypothetical protein